MLHFSICSAGIKITSFWMLLFGTLLAPFVIWQSLFIGFLIYAIWAIFACVVVPMSLHSFQGSISLGEVRISKGILFKTSHHIPTRFVTGVTRLQTPLLRLANCSVLILYTSGTFILLPGISNNMADQIIHVIQGGSL